MPEGQLTQVGEEIDKELKTLQTSFFIMPGHALKSLRDELQISTGEKMSEGILFRYGFRCGEGMIQKMNIDHADVTQLAALLPGFWAGVGLGRVSVKSISEKELVVSFEESVEALTMPQGKVASCHFTRGYLAGMASAIAGQDFVAVEEQCCSKGDPICVHRLQVTLEGIAPSKEDAVRTKERYDLERGISYLIEEESPDKSYDIFTDAVTHGAQGLCITRDFPDLVRRKYGLKKTPVLWLSNAEKDFAVEPVQLGKLYHKIEDFLKKSESSVILLCGLEYLITQNNYTSALKFLQLVKDQIAIYNSLLVAPLSPYALTERDLKLIERELVVVDPTKPKGKPQAPPPSQA